MPSERNTRDSVRVQATVLFADISGFVAISERLDPEKVTEFINGCFERLETVVFAHGGMVDKYIGDCLVAVFGLSPITDDAAEHAVRAAIDMRDALYQFNRDVCPPTPLDVHIGISSGPVVTAMMGSAAKRRFAVIGETVNLAAYLEHASAQGQIIVGPETRRQTDDRFEYRALAPVQIDENMQPAAVFELLAEKPTRTLKRDSERRQATIMFADVLGFRSLAEQMDPDTLTHLMNECLAMVAGAIVQRGGVVDKYIGECVMALFGVPNAIENAPQQAINAAIDIRHRIAQFNVTHGLHVPLRVRIGLNTGLVIAGEIGGRVRRDFTVMGDAVNLAARLKDLAGEGRVLVGPETHRYTRNDFEFRHLSPLTLKGREQAVQPYELQSVSEQAHRAPGDRKISSPLVGRGRELEQIVAQVHAVVGGRGHIVMVIGEAGIGKTRLLAEAMQATQDVPATLLKGRSLSIGQGLSFHPFIDLLQRWSGIDDDDDANAAVRLEAAIGTLVPPNQVREIFPFVATMMGIHLSGEPAALVAGIDGSVLEKLIAKSLRALFQRLAARQALVILFEDLHWADASSIKLLEALLPLASTEAIVFVLAFRPDHADTSGRIAHVVRVQQPGQLVEVRLTPLSDAQCRMLIDNLLQIDNLPQSVRALITRTAEGNPFYIEEVVRSFIDQGAVESHEGRLRVTAKIDTVVIPGTIQEVIMARVDQLDEPTRHMLQMASVIGRAFYHRIIAAIMAAEGVSEQQLTRQLAYPKERQLVFERRSRNSGSVLRRSLLDELEYVFQHALVQETIYESILQRTRKSLHLKVAQTIEHIFQHRLADFYGMLAYHYSRAELPEKAEEYLFKAGDEAARAAASTEALHFFREASRLYMLMYGEGGDRRKKALLEKSIALALLNKGDLTESIEHFDRAAALLGQHTATTNLGATLAFAGNLTALWAQLYLHVRRRRRVDDWEQEYWLCEILFNRARAQITSDPTRLFFDSVRALRRFNEIDAARIDQASAIYASGAGMFFYSAFSFAVGRRILAIAKRLQRPGNVKDAFTCASMEFICHYLEGDWSDAHVVDSGLVEDALRHGQLWDANTYLGLLCDRKIRQGDFSGARAVLDHLGEMNDTYGFSFAGANREGMTAILLLEERQLDQALRVADSYFAARHEDSLKVLGLGMRAKTQVLLGDLDGAAVTLAAAAKITDRSREIPPWHLSAYAAARLRHDVALLEQAIGAGAPLTALQRRAARSVRYARRIAAKVAMQRVEIYQLIGHACWLLDRRRDALRYWQTSVRVGTTLSALPELARTYALASRCLEHAGGSALRLEGFDAGACREKARQLFREIGLVREKEESRRATLTAA